MDSNSSTVDSPAYLQVKHRLTRMLAHRKPGTRLPAILRLAEQLGAGQTNTHRAVRDLVEEGVLISAPRRGTFIAECGQATKQEGDEPVQVRPALQGVTIGVAHNYTNPPDGFVMTMIEAFEARMSVSGCRLVRQALRPNADSEQREPWLYDHVPGAGVAIFNPNPHPEIRCRPDQRLVVVNTAFESPVALPGGFDVVTVEQEHSAYLAGRHLRACGGSRACYLGIRPRDAEDYDETSRQRLRGFERGWGSAVDPSARLHARFYTIQAGAALVSQWLARPQRPDCIFTASDELAVGFILGASAHGLEPGRDFQIVGFDGQPSGRALAPGPLTTIDVPCAEMGRRAAELLIDRFRDSTQPVRRLQLACTLFEGQTTHHLT